MTTDGRDGGGQNVNGVCSVLLPLLPRPSPFVLTRGLRCRPLPLWLFVLRGNTALSRGWCTPLTRGSAVCEQNASHNTQHANPGLLF